MASLTAAARNARPVVRAIRSRQEFAQAVAELDHLADSDPGESTREYDRMELLGILVASYEAMHEPDFEPASPQELVKLMAEQQGIAVAELANLLGGRSRMSEFLSGARELSKKQILDVRDTMGIPADLLLTR